MENAPFINIKLPNLSAIAKPAPISISLSVRSLAGRRPPPAVFRGYREFFLGPSSIMFSGWKCWTFGKGKLKTDAQLLTAMDKLGKTSLMLEEKEKEFKEKASQEVEKSKELTRAKDEAVARRSLKKKRLYEQQLEPLGNSQLQIAGQMIMLEGAKAATETADALRTGAAVMKTMQEKANMFVVMDEVNEQNESMRQMLQAISAPPGADSDEQEHEADAESPPLSSDSD
ncbi:hypothetical protein EUGRSUZ_C00937 [Eucalyptus grandis]|uniref:Uncharacterized protein n=2 Tax=Eucalyptus grandis TaxID=71139 RepID=A0A059CNR4_EUCGR|nr:hypothetical protein EUGRSUZ_C00937 [Eucalyptus grandis]